MPSSSLRHADCRAFALTLAILLAHSFSVHAASLDGLGVAVENRSELVLCAEKDNVTLTFANAQVRRFRIEAAHPAYIHTLRKDSFAPDWAACDFAEEAQSQPKPPNKVTLYEDVGIWVTGYTFASFWRDRKVPVRIGDRVENDFHLIQVWLRHNERAEEVLVLYPTDGYWRARPLPPTHLGWSAYGSSFLVGPVEDAGRPVVNLSSVSFDPETRIFDLDFENGGGAKLAIATLDHERMQLDISFDRPVADQPFAALRSMYVTRFNADVAEVATLEKGAKGWREEPIMTFEGAKDATDVWAGRLVPSRHNTSAPDMVFSGFYPDAAAANSAAPKP